ncbi:hypothetical protein IWZ00DRAFT_151201 [Phyllosticta capitalensis]
MKYGNTLQQRSIPQWGTYNIDYDDIKHLIKEHTTPGSGKAVAIPGQGNQNDSEFEDHLFAVLAQEHRRIDLFVKSKTGEIERRLNHITKQIDQNVRREQAAAPDDRLTARRRQKYGRIESDVLKAGEEIRSLARFIGAQRLGFAKLLKKYRKWTGSESLGPRFKHQILNQPGTFSQTDLSPLLNYWTDSLHAVRDAYQAADKNESPRIAVSDMDPSVKHLADIPKKIHAAAESTSEVDLDASLATLPLGQSGARASYWVHPEQVVEIQVLLLQSLRLFNGKTRPSSRASPFETPKRRNSNERLDSLADNERTDDFGVLFLDDAERYARQRSATTVVETEETPGKPAARVLGRAQWNSSGEASIVIANEGEANAGTSTCVAKMKRKHLPVFLHLDRPFHSRTQSGLETIAETDAQPDTAGSSSNPVDDLRAWLQSHREVRPVAGYCSKRSRFVGLENDYEHGTWATLDTDIYMKPSLLPDLADSEWPTKVRSDSHPFPFAVLTVRTEGAQAHNIIKTLDHSHLTERVRGFSMEPHTIWTCCKPSLMQPPYWLPMLDRDIRKLPEKVPRQHSRRGSAIPIDSSTSRQTSISTSSVTDGQTSRYVTLNCDTSATSYSEADSPQQNSKKAKPEAMREFAAIQSAGGTANVNSQGYWNEYDNPEDDDDANAYVIYVDPFSSPKIPGQETLSKLFSRIKNSFRGRRPSTQESLLSANSHSVEDSDEADLSPISTRDYGTLPTPATSSKPRQPKLKTTANSSWNKSAAALLDIFRPSSRDASAHGSFQWTGYRPRSSDSAHQPLIGSQPSDLHDLLADLESRRQERESTKLRLCALALAAALVVLAITWTLAATSRRKLRREVDGVVVVGTVASLVFTGVGVLCALSKKQSPGIFWSMLLSLIVAAVCLADGGLLVWLLN